MYQTLKYMHCNFVVNSNYVYACVFGEEKRTLTSKPYIPVLLVTQDIRLWIMWLKDVICTVLVDTNKVH